MLLRRTWSVSTKQKNVPSFLYGTLSIEGWKWGQEFEHLSGLMWPENTHHLVKITVELADILGIELHEGK